MGPDLTNAWARELLATNEGELPQLVARLMDVVADELGMPPLPSELLWPVDLVDLVREFLTAVAADDLDRVRAPGSRFEQLGTEIARGGVPFDVLARGIRISSRRIQAQAHRALIADGRWQDTEMILAFLARIVSAGEDAVTAAHTGYRLFAVDDPGEDARLRQLASWLIYGNPQASELAADVGWPDDVAVCAIVASVDDAAAIRRAAPRPVAHYPREESVVLVHPVEPGTLATSLRPALQGRTCVVGTAGPLDAVPGSLGLAQRLAGLAGSRTGACFADDHLHELACSAVPLVVAALRRKYLHEIDALPADQRRVLLETLRQWLLHWGHRPGIAQTLDVHPQTVSGRINRLKDLLADDLDDPTTRSELLVLLTAERLSAERLS